MHMSVTLLTQSLKHAEENYKNKQIYILRLHDTISYHFKFSFSPKTCKIWPQKNILYLTFSNVEMYVFREITQIDLEAYRR